MLSSSFPTLLLHFNDGNFKKSRPPCRFTIAMIRFFSFSIFMYKDFSVPTECAAITAGDDLRGLGTCHQQAFWQEYRKRIPAKIRNLTEDCIACQYCPEFGTNVANKVLVLKFILFEFNIFPVLLFSILLVGLQICISYGVSQSIEKDTLVERLRTE